MSLATGKRGKTTLPVASKTKTVDIVTPRTKSRTLTGTLSTPVPVIHSYDADFDDPQLSHFDADGAARMVDVGAKAETERVAVASGTVTMAPATAAAVRAGSIGKGDVLGIARVAGIQGAKRASDLIPLCHPLRITGIDLGLEVTGNTVAITATVRAFDRTGVEMEAICAVSAAAMTVYDMCKAIDRGMVISNIQLDEKRGGKSGTWKR
jgi:cyclic pyranopterin phosphate synthase